MVRRGLRFAVVVGIVLIAINHGDALLQGRTSALLFLKMALTVLVPYCVSVLSSVAALKEASGGGDRLPSGSSSASRGGGAGSQAPPSAAEGARPGPEAGVEEGPRGTERG